MSPDSETIHVTGHCASFTLQDVVSVKIQGIHLKGSEIDLATCISLEIIIIIIIIVQPMLTMKLNGGEINDKMIG